MEPTLFSFLIKDNLSIFVDESGNFILKGHNEYNLNNDDYSLYLLPLLEQDKNGFWNYASHYQHLDSQKLNNIVEKLIRFPFEHKMEYWAEKAIAWIDTNNLTHYLWLYTLDNGWMSQGLKHKILRVIKSARL